MLSTDQRTIYRSQGLDRTQAQVSPQPSMDAGLAICVNGYYGIDNEQTDQWEVRSYGKQKLLMLMGGCYQYQRMTTVE